MFFKGQWVVRAYHQIICWSFNYAGVFFGSLFMVEIDVKDDFLLKNEVLLSKNVIFVYKGNYPKILIHFFKDKTETPPIFLYENIHQMTRF